MKSIAVADEQRWTRGSWLTLMFVLGFTALCIAVSAVVLAQPGDGCQLDALADPPLRIQACFGDWPTPLRAGDILLSVNGVSAIDLDALNFARTRLPADWAASGEATYVVRRDGVEVTLQVPLGKLGAAGILRVFGTSLVMQLGFQVVPVFLGSLVVFFLAPRAGAAQLLLIGSSGLFAVVTFAHRALTVPLIFHNGPAWTPLTLVALALIWGWLFIPSALLIVLTFPRRVWPLTRWPRATPALIFGLPLAGTAFALATGSFGPIYALLTASALAVVFGGMAITAYTFLRVGDRVVRAQTAWMLVGLFFGFAFWPLTGNVIPDFRVPPSIVGLIFPLSMGIAITRYRLFDIEVIIRRTLIYSALTLTLGLIYLGVVVVLQALVVPLIGSSELAIVVSTLAIAALFFPLRRRIQNLIDRRFYRRKYNAQQVLAAFAATARDETDLARLTEELLHVVDTTMQPEFVRLWIKPVDHTHSDV